MLRAKRRRTRMHDSKGNPIFNTNNATSKQNRYVMKNNYLESLKTKGNDHNKCKRYYSDKEVIEKHQINLKDSSLIINFSSHKFTNQGCQTGLLSALYNNTTDLSGTYKFLGYYTYYLDKAIDAKDDNNNTVKSIVFMTYVGELGPYGFWGIIGFPFSESQQTFEEAVQYYYEYIIIKNGLKYSDFTNVCSVLSHKLGSNDITKYYSSTWNEGTNTNTSIGVTMTPDTKHSSADKIKHNMTFRYCKTSIEQNPILGYRKQLKDCENCDIPKNPINTIYKDNYAKTCGKFRKEDSSVGKYCAYNNVILPKQNNNGIVDASYNYSTSQYLSRPNFMKCNNVYKKSNPRFSNQGAVSGGSRLNRLKYQTIVKSQQKVYQNDEDENRSNNKINGVYPTNLYRNTRPIYKQIYSKNVKCKGISCNGLLQFCPN